MYYLTTTPAATPQVAVTGAATFLAIELKCLNVVAPRTQVIGITIKQQ